MPPRFFHLLNLRVRTILGLRTFVAVERMSIAGVEGLATCFRFAAGVVRAAVDRGAAGAYFRGVVGATATGLVACFLDGLERTGRLANLPLASRYTGLRIRLATSQV